MAIRARDRNLSVRRYLAQKCGTQQEKKKDDLKNHQFHLTFTAWMTTVTRSALIEISGSIPVLSIGRCLVVSMTIDAFKRRRAGRVCVTVAAECPAARTVLTAGTDREERRVVKGRRLPRRGRVARCARDGIRSCSMVRVRRFAIILLMT
jgi:hypothetical protein